MESGLKGVTIAHHVPILFLKRLAPALGLPGDTYTRGIIYGSAETLDIFGTIV